MIREATVAAVLALGLGPNAAHAQRLVDAGDLAKVRYPSDPQVSPDGAWIAYVVSASDTARDHDDTDVWLASWDGAQQIRVTRSPSGEHAPRWSPDGRWIAFLSDRDDPHEVSQLWLYNRAGGGSRRRSTARRATRTGASHRSRP